MKIGNNDYKLVFLDTNALREMALNKDNIQQKFLNKFLNGTSSHIPCFSIYNLIELKPYEDIYEKFISFFKMIPFFIINPYKTILLEEHFCAINNKKLELTNKLLIAYSPNAGEKNFNNYIEKIWEDIALNKDIADMINGLNEVKDTWSRDRDKGNLMLERLGMNNVFNEKFYKSSERETIKKDLRNHKIFVNDNFKIENYPGFRIMEYSHFSRVYMTKKSITKNDVMDIKISCIIPYVDVVITEAFQAEVYKKSKRFISQMKNIEIFRLGDF